MIFNTTCLDIYRSSSGLFCDVMRIWFCVLHLHDNCWILLLYLRIIVIINYFCADKETYTSAYVFHLIAQRDANNNDTGIVCL
jgi:hypothetical protein